MDLIANHLPTILEIFSGIFISFMLWFAKRYVAPYLKVEKRHRYAEYIAIIADDITDDLVRNYPDKEWAKRLDEAVDKIMVVCGVDDEIARRAASAAFSRKTVKEPA